MSRNHRKPGVIRVICTDSRHRGQPGYDELGYHYIGTLRLAYPKGKLWANAGFKWHGPREAVEQIESRDQQIVMTPGANALTELPLPVKMWRTEDDKFVWRFRCTGDLGCGRDPQHGEAYLAQVVKRWMKEKPDASRVLLDITRL